MVHNNAVNHPQNSFFADSRGANRQVAAEKTFAAAYFSQHAKILFSAWSLFFRTINTTKKPPKNTYNSPKIFGPPIGSATVYCPGILLIRTKPSTADGTSCVVLLQARFFAPYGAVGVAAEYSKNHDYH